MNLLKNFKVLIKTWKLLFMIIVGGENLNIVEVEYHDDKVAVVVEE